jgi:hypothetical protein
VFSELSTCALTLWIWKIFFANNRLDSPKYSYFTFLSQKASCLQPLCAAEKAIATNSKNDRKFAGLLDKGASVL